MIHLRLICVASMLSMIMSAKLEGDMFMLWHTPIFVAERNRAESPDPVVRLKSGLASQYSSLAGLRLPQSMSAWTIQGTDVEGCLSPRSFGTSENTGIQSSMTMAGSHFHALSSEQATTVTMMDPRGGGRAPFDKDFTHRLLPGQLLLYPSWLTVFSADTMSCSQQRVTRHTVHHTLCRSEEHTRGENCGSLTDLWSIHPYSQPGQVIAGPGQRMQPREVMPHSSGSYHELFGANIYIEPSLHHPSVTARDLDVVLNKGLARFPKDHKANGAFFKWQSDMHEEGRKWKALYKVPGFQELEKAIHQKSCAYLEAIGQNTDQDKTACSGAELFLWIAGLGDKEGHNEHYHAKR